MANLEQLDQMLDKANTDTLIKLRKAISLKINKRNKSERQIPPTNIKGVRSKSYNVLLERLIWEDWSYLFLDYDNTPSDFYVYMHGNPKTLKKWALLERMDFAFPIYIGLGQGGRAFNFRRSPAHLKELNLIMSHGYEKEEIVSIIADSLSEREARELESKLILFFGLTSYKKKGDKRRNSFNGKRSLFNNKYEPIPKHYEHLM